jgi:hypothetical protein
MGTGSFQNSSVTVLELCPTREAATQQIISAMIKYKGGSDISGILKRFIKHATTQLKMVRFY